MRFWHYLRNLGQFPNRLARIEQAQSRLNWKVNIIMGKQADLDALVARIDTAVAGIRQDIADLRAANPQVDFTALEQRVTGLEGLDAENPVLPPQE